ncbi:MAG: hypothetical protein IJY16_02650 [Clostridia bacterium]|nr:hypothetical protein [Clostridia bacterium]
MSKKFRPMGLGLIFAGFCFFFNPYFAALDLLPDFIGALLIWIGLLPYARISEPMSDARRAFLKLTFADAVKNLMLLVIFGMGASNEQPTMLLIAAFCSASLGLFFFLPAVNSLFDGIEYLALTYDCKPLYAVTRGRYSSTERLKRFIRVFLVLREVISLLPEFAALLNSAYVDSGMVWLYDYIGVMRLLAAIPVFIAGVIYLVRVIAYFVRFLRLREFRLQLSEAYAAYMDAHPGVTIRARHLVAFILLGLGSAFTLDFYLDFQNIIPDAIAALFLLMGVLLLKAPWSYRLPVAAAAAGFGVIATISFRFSYRFYMDFAPAAIEKSEKAAYAYFNLWFSALGEMLTFLVFLAMLLVLLRYTIRHYAGYVPEHTDGNFESRSLTRLREEFDGMLIKCFMLGFISALFSFLYDYIKVWPEKRIYRILEFLWMPDFLFAIIFAAYFCYLLSTISIQIEARHYYE